MGVGIINQLKVTDEYVKGFFCFVFEIASQCVASAGPVTSGDPLSSASLITGTAGGHPHSQLC